MGIASAIGLAAPLVGGILGSKSASSQAGNITRAADQSTALQREQLEYLKKIMAPYQQAGQDALPALQAFVNQPAQSFNFDYASYFKSPEYAALSQQAEQAALRNAAATGGIRGGDAQVALASIAPQLAQQGLNNAMNQFQLNQGANTNKYNQLQGLVGLGLGSSQQVGNAAQLFGQAAGQNAVAAGQARADAAGQRYNALGGLLSSLF